MVPGVVVLTDSAGPLGSSRQLTRLSQDQEPVPPMKSRSEPPAAGAETGKMVPGHHVSVMEEPDPLEALPFACEASANLLSSWLRAGPDAKDLLCSGEL